MLRQWQAECIKLAISRYKSGQKHFLAQATPGAGKTIMSAYLSKEMIDTGNVDLVLCISPSVNVASGFTTTFKNVLKRAFDGKLGSLGLSITYQSLQHISHDFWDMLSNYRVLTIIDEIHHCSGETAANANSWGEQLLLKVQKSSTYTLALTGTPWRSDQVAIALSSYTDPEGRIVCDYQYTLKQAISDRVCRKPKLVLVDNEQLHFSDHIETINYQSIQALLSDRKSSYLSVLHNADALSHILKQANKKLVQIKITNHNAAGLVVAASVAHAKVIQHFIANVLNQSSVLVSYQDPDAQKKISQFKNSSINWIVSIGMVSEGTDIPRLQVCCYLSNIRTELYFRQVLGRVLRSTNSPNQDAWFYTFAEQNLINFAEEIERDIPNSCLFMKKNGQLDQNNEHKSLMLFSERRQLAKESQTALLTWGHNTDYSEQNDPDSNSKHLTLGQFRERVIEAYAAV